MTVSEWNQKTNLKVIPLETAYHASDDPESLTSSYISSNQHSNQTVTVVRLDRNVNLDNYENLRELYPVRERKIYEFPTRITLKLE